MPSGALTLTLALSPGLTLALPLGLRQTLRTGNNSILFQIPVSPETNARTCKPYCKNQWDADP